jgi:RNA polymerase-binding transcription factor DksA
VFDATSYAASDTASDTAEVHPDAVLLDQVNADLGAVDEALRRLDDESYGTCQVCGAQLDARILEEDPLLMLCPDHQR